MRHRRHDRRRHAEESVQAVLERALQPLSGRRGQRPFPRHLRPGDRQRLRQPRGRHRDLRRQRRRPRRLPVREGRDRQRRHRGRALPARRARHRHRRVDSRRRRCGGVHLGRARPEARSRSGNALIARRAGSAGPRPQPRHPVIEHDLDIATADGAMNSFVVHPEEGGPFPVVFFYMDAPGKREELHDMARRHRRGRLLRRAAEPLLPSLARLRPAERSEAAMARHVCAHGHARRRQHRLRHASRCSRFVDADAAADASRVGAWATA